MEGDDGLMDIVERVLASKEWHCVSFFKGGPVHLQGRFGHRLFENVSDFMAWVNRPVPDESK